MFNNICSIIMIKILSIVLLIISVSSESQQKFVYVSNETVTIETNSMLEVSLSLTTQSDEYLSEAAIEAVLAINQTSTLYFNIIYFNYQNQAGQQCYQNWIMNSTQLNTGNCSSFDEFYGNLPSCLNFTNCLNETIQFPLRLSEEQYKQSVILIQNVNSTEELILETQVRMELASRNTWFYWGVGLTCLLLISLVVYAGIIFYWMLKYKKTKKMFEQFKLTEEEESIKKEN